MCVCYVNRCESTKGRGFVLGLLRAVQWSWVRCRAGGCLVCWHKLQVQALARVISSRRSRLVLDSMTEGGEMKHKQKKKKQKKEKKKKQKKKIIIVISSTSNFKPKTNNSINIMQLASTSCNPKFIYLQTNIYSPPPLIYCCAPPCCCCIDFICA